MDNVKHLREVDESLKTEIRRENNRVETLNNDVFLKKLAEKEANEKLDQAKQKALEAKTKAIVGDNESELIAKTMSGVQNMTTLALKDNSTKDANQTILGETTNVSKIPSTEEANRKLKDLKDRAEKLQTQGNEAVKKAEVLKKNAEIKKAEEQ